jgi:KUP system potassium uptake protein
MFASTVLIALQTRYVKQLPIAVGLAFFIPFGFFDGMSFVWILLLLTSLRNTGLFWGASLKKVPYGAWVPLMIGLILCVPFVQPSKAWPYCLPLSLTLMVFWNWAKVTSLV